MATKQIEKIGAFQILLMALSVYVLIGLLVEAVIPLSASSRSILLHVDTGICFVFLFDFFYRFARAEKKMHFLRWGWIDLASSIPALPSFRVGRAVRVIRVIRLLRGFRSAKTIGEVLFAHRAKGALATAVFLCVLLIVFSSIAILHVEVAPDSNIHGPEDALWWSIVTITTVGYGDRFPTTSEGRIIGTALMVSGVGLFAVLSGAFASWFTRTANDGHDALSDETNAQIAILIEEIRTLRAEIRNPENTRNT